MAPRTTSRIADLARIREIAASGRAREIRTAARLSLAEVGREVGVADVTVLRWERGHCLPHGQKALRYLRLLDELEELAGG